MPGYEQGFMKTRYISISIRMQMDCMNTEGVSKETTPIYLPDDALFSKKLVMHAHLQTLHGGVSLTMAKIREKYWIPRLGRLTERVINECHECKRFQVTTLANPPTGNLLKERTEGSVPSSLSGSTLLGLSSTSTRIKRR